MLNEWFNTDIALITLPRPFNWSPSIEKICLPKDSFYVNSKNIEEFIITGLGMTEDETQKIPKYPDEILYADVDKVNSEKCYEDMTGKSTLPKKWAEEKELGFCSRGKNGEVVLPGDRE